MMSAGCPHDRLAIGKGRPEPRWHPDGTGIVMVAIYPTICRDCGRKKDLRGVENAADSFDPKAGIWSVDEERGGTYTKLL